MPTPSPAACESRNTTARAPSRQAAALEPRLAAASWPALALAATLAAGTGPVSAQPTSPARPPSQLPPTVQAAVQPANGAAAAAPAADDALRWFVEREAAAQLQGMGRGSDRLEVRLGSIDTRLTLAPCARIEPFVPPGARLWGRSAIGVRCTDGAAWSVSLPVTVAVRGQALVASGPLQAGAAPGPGDVRVEEIELTREPVSPLQDATALAGKVLTRPVAAGQALRPDMLRAVPAVMAGDPVRLVLVGDGFSITADGQALAPAADGQPVRVRTESGRVVTGKVRGRTVEIRL